MFAPKGYMQFNDFAELLEEYSYSKFSKSLADQDLTLQEGVFLPKTFQALILESKKQNKDQIDKAYEAIKNSTVTFKDKTGEKKTTTGGSREEFDAARIRMGLDAQNVTIAFHKLFRTWALCRFMQMDNCSIFSQNGQELGMSRELSSHAFDLEWKEWQFPINDRSPFYSTLKLMLDQEGLDIASYFHFIEHSTGTISHKHAIRMADNQVFNFQSQIFGLHSLGGQIEIAQNLEGWVVCFKGIKEKGITKSSDEIFDMLKVELPNSISSRDNQNLDKKQPRSIKTETAVYNFFMAYMDKYPDDNPPREKARSHFGKLDDGNVIGERAWKRIWDKVAAKHTRISVSGRKPDWTPRQFDWKP